MDKKKFLTTLSPDDLKGFEEFIEGQPNDSTFLSKAQVKKDTNFEHFTFLSNDSERLMRIRDLLKEKVTFTHKFNQRESIVKAQEAEIRSLQRHLFEILDRQGSPYRKSIRDVFDSYFGPG